MPGDEFKRDGWCEEHRLETKPKKKKGIKSKDIDSPTEFDKDGWCEEHRVEEK